MSKDSWIKPLTITPEDSKKTRREAAQAHYGALKRASKQRQSDDEKAEGLKARYILDSGARDY